MSRGSKDESSGASSGRWALSARVLESSKIIAAVVVGAGFIGCEVAASLSARGLSVTLVEPAPTPLAAALPDARADIWTTPYVAQLSNPVAIPPDGQASYETSRTEGYDKSVAQMKKVYDKCKLTGFVLMGFSQGAVIAGDIAGEIGAGKGVVPAENILGVGLISDPRREPGDARTAGPNPPGVGVEVAYGGFSFGSLSLRGKREGGFGAVKDRTVSLCGNKDPICNQPKDIFQAGNIATTLPELQKVLTGNSHALYATTTDWAANGQTATQWMQAWARGVIDKAPKPPHS